MTILHDKLKKTTLLCSLMPLLFMSTQAFSASTGRVETITIEKQVTGATTSVSDPFEFKVRCGPYAKLVDTNDAEFTLLAGASKTIALEWTSTTSHSAWCKVTEISDATPENDSTTTNTISGGHTSEDTASYVSPRIEPFGIPTEGKNAVGANKIVFTTSYN